MANNNDVSVRLSAAALSQLLAHTMRRTTNNDDEVVEGLLFGIYRESAGKVSAKAADDSDELNVSVGTEVEVEGCIALGSACSFYAPSGAVHVPTVKALVARLDASATVVGWFRCKMRSLAQMSLREVAVLRSLQAISPRLPLLFASVATHQLSGSLSIDYRFVSFPLVAPSTLPLALPVSVVNLQQSAVDAFAGAVDRRTGASGAAALAAAATAAGVAPTSFGLSPHVARLQASSLAELKARVDAVHSLTAQLSSST